MTTPLARRIKRQIGLSGPIPVSEYMAACLFDPEHGYYTTRQPFGRGGDFITAPEISQTFGEMLAIWSIRLWHDLGRPSPFCLAEIGPGRGTLMADMLRTLRALAPDFLQAASLRMIETSPRLARIQQAALAKTGQSAEWIEDIRPLPATPLVLIGNELFDAIPVRQLVRAGGGWQERRVGLDEDGRLCFVAAPAAIDPALLPDGASGQADGTIFEIAPAREALAGEIGRHVASHGGAALLFDYGHEAPGFGDTLQAVRDHAYEDVLASPGLADLTSHVDFHALAQSAGSSGASASLLRQGEFLALMGIRERGERLAAGRAANEAEAIRSAIQRLIEPGQMGTLFKAMCIHAARPGPYPFDSAGQAYHTQAARSH